MKKILILLLSSLLVLCLPLSALAAEAHGLSSRQISDEELAILYDTALYDESLEGVTLTDQPIIKIYRFELTSDLYLRSRTVSETISAVGKSSHYLIGGMHVAVQQRDDTATVKRIISDDVPFITDIKSMGNTVNIYGTVCKILDIYCFDAENRDSDFVYLITDQGTYVKCYDWSSSGYSPIIFTEEEFSEYAISYYRHIIRTSTPGLAGYLTFIHYVKKIYGTSDDYGTRYEQTRTIVTVSAAALLVLGASAFVIVKRRKKKQS